VLVHIKVVVLIRQMIVYLLQQVMDLVNYFLERFLNVNQEHVGEQLMNIKQPKNVMNTKQVVNLMVLIVFHN
jgi:hypothetical protein